MAFEEVLTARGSSLCTLIYYPQEKLRRIRERRAKHRGMVSLCAAKTD